MIGYNSPSLELSAKEKSLLGIGVFPGFSDYFNTVAEGADPDATYWSKVITGGGDAQCDMSTTPAGLRLIPGASEYNMITANTKDKFMIDISRSGLTTVHFKTNFKVNDLSGRFACGLYVYSNEGNCGVQAGTSLQASLYITEDTVTVHSCDGNTNESADVADYFSDDTYADFEIRITSSDVKFYVDNILRATLSTNKPTGVVHMAFSADYRFSVKTEGYIQFAELWGE